MSAQQVTDEVNRQLAEQRAQADALATRAGVLIATSSLVTGLLATQVLGTVPGLTTPLLVVGVAAILGVIVLCSGRLITGPAASQLGRHSADPMSDLSPIVDAKILIIEANSRALLRTELFFGLQALATVGGVISLLFSVIGRAS